MTKGGGVLSKAASVLTGAASTASRKAQDVRESERTKAAVARAVETKKQAKTAVTNRIKSAAERSVDWAMNESRGVIKASIDDEKAPRFVRDFTSATFEAVWPDVAEEVRRNVMASVYEQFDGPVQAWREPRVVRGLGKLRAWFLHSFLPHDKTLWEQMRWASYWVLVLWSAVPYYGCMFTFWLTMFLLMDKRDEYTLINFILQFKSLQFVTLGFLGMLIGTAMTIYCLSNNLEHHTCDKHGPGLQADFYYQLGAFALQALLSWICFLLLPYSKAKGGVHMDGAGHESKHVPTEDEIELSHYRPTAGGYLRKLMLYDVCCFLLVLLWIGLTARRPHMLTAEHAWMLRATGYWAKTAYGLLSLPFIIFVIPPFNLIFTHAIPTAYDQAGDAVPLLSATQRAQKEAQLSGGQAGPQRSVPPGANAPLDADREVAV